MVIGLDIDGTITRHPPFFAFLSQSLAAAGHQVVIITFREDRPRTEADLAEWGVAYHRLVMSSLDECLNHGVNGWKAHVCRDLGVDVLFEDDPDVVAEVDAATFCLVPADAPVPSRAA